MGKQRVRCPRDVCVAAVAAMIHLLSGAAWIMVVLPCHVSMVPIPYKIRDGQGINNRLIIRSLDQAELAHPLFIPALAPPYFLPFAVPRFRSACRKTIIS